MPDSFAESAEGIVLVANGIDAVVRWDGYAAQAEPAGVTPPPAGTTPTISASGVGGITGSYAAYVRFVDRNNNPSNLSPVAGPIDVTNASTFSYSNLPVPAQASVTRRQVLRNTDGQFDVFYVAVDSDDLSAATLTDSLTDGQLAGQEAVPLLDADGLPLANGYSPPPDTKPFLAFHLNRMWLGGEQAYAEGSCQVAKRGTAVAGVGTRWPANFAGRFLYVTGAGQPYEIAAVDPVAQTLTLTAPYAGETDPFAMYSIKPPPGEARALYFSQAGLPEAWPVFNAFTLPEDGDVVTGMANWQSFLWVFKRRRTYRMTAQKDPVKDGFVFFALGRGCVNHRCWVVVEEELYLLDEGGVYKTGGGDAGEQLSTPIQDLFRRGEPGSIEWSGSRYFHCSYSPAEETIRWFVTLRGTYLPRHALCLHYKTGKWWVEQYPVPVAASTLGRVGRPAGGWGDDGQVLYLGGPAGKVLVSAGTLDGVAAPGPRSAGAVTAATSDTLTDAGAAFDPTWANLPVAITAGRGKGQVRVVVAATTTRLAVNEPWAVRPDGTSRYQVGGIPVRFTGGRLRFAQAETQAARSVELQYAPTAAPQTLDLRVYQDFAVVPKPAGRDVGPGQRAGVAAAAGRSEYVLDLSRPAGHYWVRLDGHRELGTEAPRLARVQLDGVSGPDPVVVGEMVLTGLVR